MKKLLSIILCLSFIGCATIRDNTISTSPNEAILKGFARYAGASVAYHNTDRICEMLPIIQAANSGEIVGMAQGAAMTYLATNLKPGPLSVALFPLLAVEIAKFPQVDIPKADSWATQSFLDGFEAEMAILNKVCQ